MTTNNSSNIDHSSLLSNKSTNIPSEKLAPTKAKQKGRILTKKQRMAELEIMNYVDFTLGNSY